MSNLEAFENLKKRLTLFLEKSPSPTSKDEEEEKLNTTTKLLVEWNQLIKNHSEDIKEANLILEASIKKLELLKKELEENLSKYAIENLKKKQALCAELEKNYGSEDKKALIALLNKVKQKWTHIGPVDRIELNALEERFKAGTARILQDCESYLKEQNQLEETSVETRQKIINEVKTINQSPSLAFTHQNKFRELHQKWKATHPLSYKNLHLNQSFKKEIDLFFKNLEEGKKEHLESLNQSLTIKEKLLKNLKHLATNLKESHWDNERKIAINLYKEWIKSKYYRDKKAQQLESEFEKEFEELFNRFGEGEDKRIANKQKIIDEITNLLDECNKDDFEETTDLTKVATKITELKQTWERFIPLSQKKYQKLNHHFNSKVDEIFKKCPNLASTIAQHKDDNLLKKRNLLKKAEVLFSKENNLSTVDDKKNFHQEVIALSKAWQQVGDVPRKYFAELHPFRQHLDQYFQKKRKLIQNIRQNEEQNYLKKKELVDKLEVLKQKFVKKSDNSNSTTGAESFDKTKHQEAPMSVEKLKMMLELNRQMAHSGQNASNGNNKKNSSANLREEIRKIQKSWKEIGPVPRNKDQALFQHYRNLCNKLYNLN